MNKNILIWIIGMILLSCSVMAVGETLFNETAETGVYGNKWTGTGSYNTTQKHTGSYSVYGNGALAQNLTSYGWDNVYITGWFYDENNQAGGVRVNTFNIGEYAGTNLVGVGVHTAIDMDEYVYNRNSLGGFARCAGATRSLGWHNFSIYTNSTYTNITIDNIQCVSGTYAAPTEKTISLNTNNALGNYYDDILICNGTYTNCTSFGTTTAPTLSSNLSLFPSYINKNISVQLNITNNNAIANSCFISSTNSNFSCTSNYTANNITIIPCFFSQSNAEQNTTLTPYCNSSSYNITATNKTIYFDNLNPRITTAINNSIIVNQTNFWFYINDLTTMIFNISDSCNGTYTNTTGTATGNYTYPVNYSSITKNCALGINWINITVCDNLSQCSTSINYWHKFNVSSSQLSTVYEGTQADYSLLIKYPNINLSFNISSYLNLNSINYSVTRKDLDNDTINYTQSIIISNISSINWAWYYNLSDTMRNLSGTQSVINMNITNCSNSTYVILNFTMYDEEFKTLINATENTTIETFITLYVPQNTSISYNYSAKNNNTLLVCIPDNFLTYGSLILDGVTKYYTDSYVTEYYYIDNFNLTNAVVPKYISLYDLITTDSTSFLITYQDENYLYKENVIIDMLRKYIPDNGNFISVEHGKTDEGGQTNLHIVTEDIIYKFNVWENGELVYTTNEYKALCQASPCQINLRKKSESTDFSSETANILYSITQQEVFSTTKLITLSYSTKDGTSAAMVMTVLLNNQTVVCNETSTSSAGSLNCNVPLVYQNSTYTTNVYKDGSFIGYKIYVLGTKLSDSLGSTGYFLAGIVDLLFILMGVLSSSATITMIFAAIGLLLTGLIGLVFMGNYIGIGSIFIYILIAIGIIIWKLRQRRFN